MNGSLRTTSLLGFLLAASACAGGERDAASGDSAAAAPQPTVGAATDTGAAGTSATTTPATSGAMMDPNTASREELLAVPGMTPTVVDSLLAGRPYADMVAVDRALARQRLTEEQRKAAYARLWKPIDLNTAKGEEILLIPGVGSRMRREFEEYRPYQSIEKFRREIGKYVDKDEVARLERYVTIR